MIGSKKPSTNRRSASCLGMPRDQEIKQRLLFELADCGAMRTADIVRQDLQSGDGIGAGALFQHDIAVRLVAIGLICALCDVDHALPYRTAVAFQGTFENRSLVVCGARWFCCVS